MKGRDLIKFVRDDGRAHVRTTGSHLHFKHPSKPGVFTIPSGGKENRDVAPGTMRPILRPAGLPK